MNSVAMVSRRCRRRPFPRGLRWLLLTLLCLPAPLRGAPESCPGSAIVAVVDHPADREPLCAAVAATVTLLDKMELELSGALTIELLPALPEDPTDSCLALYHARSHHIQLLNYPAAQRAFQRRPPAFGLAMSPALWRSYLSHELAHAAAQQQFAPGVSTFTASEYIAAVAQLASLPPPLLAELLRHYPDLPAFATEGEITALYFQLDPARFAVKAYLHYLQPNHGPTFIRHLLAQGLRH